MAEKHCSSSGSQYYVALIFSSFYALDIFPFYIFIDKNTAVRTLHKSIYYAAL